jgi:CheY-like chemotaxis protein
VEDEILIARELEARLKGSGYTVVRIALSGEEALQAASEARPDLVLMDIVLKGSLDGIAAAEEIRTRSLGRGLVRVRQTTWPITRATRPSAPSVAE